MPLEARSSNIQEKINIESFRRIETIEDGIKNTFMNLQKRIEVFKSNTE